MRSRAARASSASPAGDSPQRQGCLNWATAHGMPDNAKQSMLVPTIPAHSKAGATARERAARDRFAFEGTTSAHSWAPDSMIG